jgi:hypothetical protein
MFTHRADVVDLTDFEHRFPYAWALAALIMSGNLGSVVLMLLAQG